jgi:hypothetical protein
VTGYAGRPAEPEALGVVPKAMLLFAVTVNALGATGKLVPTVPDVTALDEVKTTTDAR